MYCAKNQLTSLNVKNGNNSKITNFAATNNPNLQCIQVDNEINAINGLAPYNNWSKDATASFSEDCSAFEKTYVPDDNFEQALIDLGYDDVIDDYVLTSNISGVTSLDVHSKSISDLTGIEDFISLDVLNCNNNRLTILDVSKNTLLEALWCAINQLTSIDITQNPALINLGCNDNQLTSLDVTQHTALKYIRCENNQLTNIDITQNVAIIDLNLGFNQLNELDISKNLALEGLWCSGNQLTSLDVSKNTALKKLLCYSTQLNELDISQNLALETLWCYSTQLNELDISKNLALRTLWCSGNQLTSLDITQNTALQNLKCYNNQLESLNVKNGSNSIISTFNATNNPSLQCIQVDNETDANNGVSPYDTWEIDASTTYSEDCSSLGIDDEILSSGLNLFPNPVTNLLSIDSKLPLEKVEIFNILGQKEMEIYSGFKSIRLSVLTSGFYIIKIYSDKGTTVRKLIKQ